MKLIGVLVAAVLALQLTLVAGWGTSCGSGVCPVTDGICCSNSCCPPGYDCAQDGSSCLSGKVPKRSAVEEMKREAEEKKEEKREEEKREEEKEEKQHEIAASSPVQGVREIKETLENLSKPENLAQISKEQILQIEEAFKIFAEAIAESKKGQETEQEESEERFRSLGPAKPTVAVNSLVTPKGIDASKAGQPIKAKGHHLHMAKLTIKPLVNGQLQPETPKGKLMQPAAVVGQDQGCGKGCVVDNPVTDLPEHSAPLDGASEPPKFRETNPEISRLQAQIKSVTNENFDLNPKAKAALDFLKLRLAALEHGAAPAEEKEAAKALLSVEK